MTFHALATFLSSLLAGYIGIFVFLRSKDSAERRIFSFLCLTTFGWLFCYSFMEGANNPKTALFFAKLGHSSVNFIPIIWLHFVRHFLNLRWLMPFVRFYYVLGFISLIFMHTTNLYIPAVRQHSWGFYPVGGIVMLIDFLVILLVAFSSYTLFVVHLRKAKYKDPPSYNRLKYGCIALVILSIATFDFLPKLTKIDFYPIGFATNTVFVCITTYAILKHQLLDINIVIRKGLVYSILITVFTVIYLSIVILTERLFQGILGYRSILISVIFASIIALIFIPLKNKIQFFIDKIFLGKTPQQIAQENELLRQELERSERLKAVGTFAAGLAHEIKNPLTAIKIFSQYLPEKYQDPAFLEKFSHLIPEQIDRIDNLVHELLDFAKPAPLELKETDIHCLLDDTLDLLSNELLKYRIEVIKKFDANDRELNDANDREFLPKADQPQAEISGNSLQISGHSRQKISGNSCLIKVDANRIKQVFLNLFLNAIDAMPEGGCLIISTSISENSRQEISENSRLNKFAEISVKDTGCGIPEKDLAHIFEPFYTTKEKGSGLGLSVVYNIIKEHKGKIEVKSKIGEGTSFIIELPLD